MLNTKTDLRIGYIIRNYPCNSISSIANEIIAHGNANVKIDVFSLTSNPENPFQEEIAKYRTNVNYYPLDNEQIVNFGDIFKKLTSIFPDCWEKLNRTNNALDQDVYHAMQIAYLARLKGIQHLHAHYAGSTTRVARLAAYFANISYSFTAYAENTFHYAMTANPIAPNLDAASAIAISDYHANDLMTIYNNSTTRVIRLYNGLDLTQHHYQTPAARQPLIIGIGDLVEKNGFSDLIYACSILRDRNIRFQCKIIGNGTLVKEFRLLVEQLDLINWIEIISPDSVSDIHQYFHQATVLAAPYITSKDNNIEEIPNILLQAMALGTPCISTDISAIPEVIHDNVTGLLIPQHSPFDLANALQYILASEQLPVKLAASARSFIEREFDIRKNSAQLRKMFQENINSTPIKPMQQAM